MTPESIEADIRDLFSCVDVVEEAPGEYEIVPRADTPDHLVPLMDAHELSCSDKAGGCSCGWKSGPLKDSGEVANAWIRHVSRLVLN